MRKVGVCVQGIGGAQCLEFIPGATPRLIAACGSALHVAEVLQEAKSVNVVKSFFEHNQRITNIAISPDSKFLAAADMENTIQTFDLQTLTVRLLFLLLYHMCSLYTHFILSVYSITAHWAHLARQ